MKILKKIFVALLVIIVVLCVISLFLPSKVHVERSMIMKAQPSVVFNQINTLSNWKQWSPWVKMDPGVQMTFNDVPSGTGASYSWKGDKTGEGTMTISESRTDEAVVTLLNFKGQGEFTAGFNLKPNNGGTELVWYMDMDNGTNPMRKYMSMIMKGMLEKQFDEGLINIKTIAENAPPDPIRETIAAPIDTTSTL